MAALGVLAVIDYMRNPIIVTDVFVGVYMVIFAGLLFSYEFMWWTPIDALNRSLRKNFGFMYGIRGKAFFIIFVAFLSLALITKRESNLIRYMTWATGISWLAVGIGHVLIFFYKPEMFVSYVSPTAGFAVDTSNV